MTSQEQERELGGWVGGKVVKGTKKGSSEILGSQHGLNAKWPEKLNL